MVSDHFEDAHSLEDRSQIAFEDLHPLKDIKNVDIFKGMTILIVDDNQDILVLISRVLKKYGIQVMTASSALEAFEIIKGCKLDLLISDIDMPGESGYSLIQKVRALKSAQIREIPAIAFSGSAEDKVHTKALASGFQTYMKKPSNPTQLIIEVAKLLRCSSKRSFSLFGDYSCLEKMPTFQKAINEDYFPTRKVTSAL
ncbi:MULTISPECIES: response regulator [Nostoc]|uniref:Response regulator n=2 Tax=Nostoc TaxID=1177 RepID=A0ABR8I5U6_9NOSO|nr:MULTISPECIES: response regulator [Nostoc]MBD2560455.1 response regulator [Nostoc linckia FACHB-391]MBD2646959.1 response regulator [Nostoc foliaceum FACHB-393]